MVKLHTRHSYMYSNVSTTGFIVINHLHDEEIAKVVKIIIIENFDVECVIRKFSILSQRIYCSRWLTQQVKPRYESSLQLHSSML